MKNTRVLAITLCLFSLALFYIFRDNLLISIVIGCLYVSFLHLLKYNKDYRNEPQNKKRFFKICMILSWVWCLITFYGLTISELIFDALSVGWGIGYLVCCIIYKKRFDLNDDETSNA